LKGGRWKTLRLVGKTTDRVLTLDVSVSGREIGSLSLGPETTEHTLSLAGLESTADRLPMMLREFTVIGLDAARARTADAATYSLQMVAVEG
jgi:hypothetical protein